MRKLYLKIYIAVLAAIVLFALLAGLSWKYFSTEAERGGASRWQMQLIRSVSGQMFPQDISLEAAQATLDKLNADTKLDLGLYSSSQQRIAYAGDAPPVVMPNNVRDAMLERRRNRGKEASGRDLNNQRSGSGMTQGPAEGSPMFAISLPGDRALLVTGYAPRRPQGGPMGPGPFGFIGMLLLIAAGIGAGSYPVIRKLTKQLEALRASVDRFGRGELSERAVVQGKDEVGALAASFNTSAQRIEQQIAAQRSLLANASHELRSPLARLKMALTLNDSGAEAQRNIAELDDLIEEILLASRLDASFGSQPLKTGLTDLAGLAAEECAKTGAQLHLVGPTVIPVHDPEHEPTHAHTLDHIYSDWTLPVDAKLIRRLIRNLLENAKRYAPQTPASCTIASTKIAITIAVEDRGPGVELAQRERIFEPFYRLPGTSEKTGGVGLGLSLCRQIVRHHRGEIVCTSREGGGSRFIVTLPR